MMLTDNGDAYTRVIISITANRADGVREPTVNKLKLSLFSFFHMLPHGASFLTAEYIDLPGCWQPSTGRPTHLDASSSLLLAAMLFMSSVCCLKNAN